MKKMFCILLILSLFATTIFSSSAELKLESKNTNLNPETLRALDLTSERDSKEKIEKIVNNQNQLLKINKNKNINKNIKNNLTFDIIHDTIKSKSYEIQLDTDIEAQKQ